MKWAATGSLLVFLLSTYSLAEDDKGKEMFIRHCRVCHGEKAAGTDKGPALVHKVYHPSHHADWSFYLAVQNGVKAHHFSFGDMPPIKAVAREEVGEIVRYVRGLQKEAKIF
ncbi:MAG: cytochrome c [Deltaproteobacteria bacterium]|nr:cytochrome c [Deltaproteobacteria bacterium]